MAILLWTVPTMSNPRISKSFLSLSLCFTFFYTGIYLSPAYTAEYTCCVDAKTIKTINWPRIDEILTKYLNILDAGALSTDTENLIVEYSTRDYCHSREYLDSLKETYVSSGDERSFLRQGGFQDECQLLKVVSKEHHPLKFQSTFERKLYLYDAVHGTQSVYGWFIIRNKRTALEFLSDSEEATLCHQY